MRKLQGVAEAVSSSVGNAKHRFADVEVSSALAQ
jgi:hypothetical protein